MYNLLERTYVPDNQRMAVPPAWFLQRIHDYDPLLVLMPSRQVPFAYVVARYKQRTRGLTDAALTASTTPDTKMCIQYGCVPVCLMYRTGPIWNADSILRSLAARDLWAHGGADAYCDKLEAQEAADKQKIKDDIRDDLWNRSGDAWRSYQHRTGQTNLHTKDVQQPRRGAADTKQPPSTSGCIPGLGDSTHVVGA